MNTHVHVAHECSSSMICCCVSVEAVRGCVFRKLREWLYFIFLCMYVVISYTYYYSVLASIHIKACRPNKPSVQQIISFDVWIERSQWIIVFYISVYVVYTDVAMCWSVIYNYTNVIDWHYLYFIPGGQWCIWQSIPRAYKEFLKAKLGQLGNAVPWCSGVPETYKNLVAISQDINWLIVALKQTIYKKIGKNWLLNPGTRNQGARYSRNG